MPGYKISKAYQILYQRQVGEDVVTKLHHALVLMAWLRTQKKILGLKESQQSNSTIVPPLNYLKLCPAHLDAYFPFGI